MEIILTEKEKRYLEMFATNQHEGAADNIGTRTPIHLVERKICKFCETDEEGDAWVCDELEGKTFPYIDELLAAAVEEKLVSRKELEEIAVSYFFCDLNDIDACSTLDEKKEFLSMAKLHARFGKEFFYYSPVAFFFIREEAERYKNDYQKHNCKDCRIFTYGLGYSNNGDMPIFRELLMRMGQELVSKKSLKDMPESSDEHTPT